MTSLAASTVSRVAHSASPCVVASSRIALTSAHRTLATAADRDQDVAKWSRLPPNSIDLLINNMEIPHRRPQQTLKETLELRSHGLHSGVPCSVQFKPVPPNTGRLFRRRDIHRRSVAPADYRKSIRYPMRQTLSMNKPRDQVVPNTIFTVEHALAALAARGIDNIVADVRGPEVPILDGSLSEFLEAMDDIGIEKQKEHEAPLVLVRERVEARIGDQHAVLEPFHDGIDISVSIAFDHPMIGEQEYQFQLVTNKDYKVFKEETAPARTFGFERDAAALHVRGVALGATPYNTLIFTDTGIHERCEPLRFDNEPARHKALDALGDLQLTGRWGGLRAKYTGTRAGHAVNTLLLRNLFADRRNFDVIPSRSVLKL